MNPSEIMQRVRAAAEIAVDELADRVHGEAVELAPLETGRLRESARVDTDQDDERGYRREVSFNTPYAAVQHEGRWETGPLAGREIRHYTTPGTGPKYLEAPLKRAIPDVEPHIARRVREALDGG
jgi:hypothetical protein